MRNHTRLVRPRSVTADGQGLVSHAGIAWLAETADLAGLTVGLSTARAGVEHQSNDPGRTLVHMVLALGDGATCLSELAGLWSPSRPHTRQELESLDIHRSDV